MTRADYPSFGCTATDRAGYSDDVSQLPQPGLGQRIAYYRKLNGWSAERLAQEAGEGVTRAILAQLEAGRRDSVSLQQFMAICLALAVPPAALLADPLHPARLVERPASMGGEGPIPVGRLQLWAAGELNAPSDFETDLPSAAKWRRLSELLLGYFADGEQHDLQTVDMLIVENPAERAAMRQDVKRKYETFWRMLRDEGIVTDEGDD